MATTLDHQGARLLQYMLKASSRVDPDNLTTFPTYMGIHEALGLEMIGRTWGDSLDLQGMTSLAGWALENGFPALTGMIIDKTEKRPGNGFFEMYGKDPNADFAWWLSEVAKARAFSWPIGSVTPERVHPAAAPQGVPPATSLGGRNARTVADLVLANSRFFLKSEWGPISPR
jgi:hypothetical protein